jgi:hypothetical protein
VPCLADDATLRAFVQHTEEQLAAAKAALAAKASAPPAAAPAAPADKPRAAQSSSPLPTVEVVADGLAAAGLREKAAFPLACVLVAGAALLGAAVVAFRRRR